MMVIRNEQMEALSKYVFDEFLKRMVVRLRNTCQTETQFMDDGAFLNLVRDGVDHASEFKIREEENLETFLEYTVRYGKEFYATPLFHGARGVLESSQLDETEKMNRINEYVIFR
jgi:hypothetical protein